MRIHLDFHLLILLHSKRLTLAHLCKFYLKCTTNLLTSYICMDVYVHIQEQFCNTVISTPLCRPLSLWVEATFNALRDCCLPSFCLLTFVCMPRCFHFSKAFHLFSKLPTYSPILWFRESKKFESTVAFSWLADAHNYLPHVNCSCAVGVFVYMLVYV